MQGTTPGESVSLPELSSDWQLRTLGNFDNNNTPDLVWQQQNTGATQLWFMTGNNVFDRTATLDRTAARGWQVAAAADFDQDGHTDILWGNPTTGQNEIWLMQGTTYQSTVALNAVAPGWEVGAVGDFTQNNQQEMIWRHRTAGLNVAWLMNGTAFQESVHLPQISPGWEIAGTADFNNDRHLDLLWRNPSSGATVIWEMNGLDWQNSVALPSINPLWTATV